VTIARQTALRHDHRVAQPPRLALDPPTGTLALLDAQRVQTAIDASRSSPRRRVIAPLHKSHDDPLHRMLNAVQPDSYIRPHRHLDPPKAEGWVLLRGALAFFTFEDDGRVRECLRVAAGGDPFGVDLAPGVYHAFVALEPDTVIYEVKPGPYAVSNDKSFAPWSPPEGDPKADEYMQGLLAEYHRRGGV
jgi:cupin fold WbuC family metalloprotein